MINSITSGKQKQIFDDIQIIKNKKSPGTVMPPKKPTPIYFFVKECMDRGKIRARSIAEAFKNPDVFTKYLKNTKRY